MDTCDNCGFVSELYHNEMTGLAFCADCDADHQEQPEVGQFHGELRELIANSSNPVLAMHLPPAMIEQAEQLLALPEESVAALVAAAQYMVLGASAGR